ncbi:hypothetical protein [Halocella sp. SP3-1]|nr:hypothetical protein [Halocella sp. SP3-1]
MNWRRFLVLLFGLSAQSRYMMYLSNQPDIIDDLVAAERYVASMLG